jgi:hypothetical protein
LRKKILALIRLDEVEKKKSSDSSRLDEVEKKNLSFKQTGRSGEENY